MNRLRTVRHHHNRRFRHRHSGCYPRRWVSKYRRCTPLLRRSKCRWGRKRLRRFLRQGSSLDPHREALEAQYGRNNRNCKEGGPNTATRANSFRTYPTSFLITHHGIAQSTLSKSPPKCRDTLERLNGMRTLGNKSQRGIAKCRYYSIMLDIWWEISCARKRVFAPDGIRA